MFKITKYSYGKLIQYGDVGLLKHHHYKNDLLPSYPDDFFIFHNLNYYIYNEYSTTEYFTCKNNDLLPSSKEIIHKELAVRKFNKSFEDHLV